MRYSRSSSRRNRRQDEFDDLSGVESKFENELYRSRRQGGADHKTLQLCRQAERALSLALAECADDLLRDLLVRSVLPAPDAGHLLVCVSRSCAAGEQASVAEILHRLERARHRLRGEVAAAITRKRAPELSFVVVGMEVTP